MRRSNEHVLGRVWAAMCSSSSCRSSWFSWNSVRRACPPTWVGWRLTGGVPWVEGFRHAAWYGACAWKQVHGKAEYTISCAKPPGPVLAQMLNARSSHASTLCRTPRCWRSSPLDLTPERYVQGFRNGGAGDARDRKPCCRRGCVV